MTEKTTVAFRVDPAVKEKWEEASESPEYDSLSHLIRLSVQKEITSDETESSGSQTADSSGFDSETIQSVTRIERVVSDIQKEVDALSQEKQSEELFDLKQVLLELLPIAPETYQPLKSEDSEIREAKSSPQKIADRIGADVESVRDALTQLEENTAQVRSAMHKPSGNTYYWRIE